MMTEALNSSGKMGRSYSTLAWFFQASTGIFLIFFMGVHLYVAHINGGAPVELFASIIQNLSNPWWFAFFIAFVWVISFHALNGLKAIVYDLGVSKGTRKLVSWAFIFAYFITVIYSTYLTIIVAGMTP